MRSLRDISVLAAAAALTFGLVGAGCSGQEASVDSAPPAEEQLQETAEMGGSQLQAGARQEEEEEEQR
jgi:hypothetical protein